MDQLFFARFQKAISFELLDISGEHMSVIRCEAKINRQVAFVRETMLVMIKVSHWKEVNKIRQTV